MKKRIIGIGACVADTLMSVPHFPKEDTKLRASGSKMAGGGPCATGLVAAAKLGADCSFIGNLANDSAGAFLLADFKKYGVSTELVGVMEGFRSFSSVIWLSEESSSRTCVFDKGDLPPLSLCEAAMAEIADADILMVDGNEMDAAVSAAKEAKKNGTTVLYDCGGLYEGVEQLLSLTDVMIPSEEFALAHTGEDDAQSAAVRLFELYSPSVVVITQGKRGGILYDGKSITPYPIYPVEVKDSNGSGDVFHGAFAFALTNGFDYEKCCHFSSAVSALKCTGIGARESVPDFETVKKFLKENGYEL
ncbi:MAG: hypothetical protein IKB38_07350 [Clostridia bacterium]|nr:hypothetical protein [Clostridia bacterium]